VTADAAAGAAGARHPDERLLPLDRYRAEVLSRIHALDPIELSLLDAHGCVLAEDVTSAAPLPGFDNSAMDGYAISAADVRAGTRLRVVDEAAAGSPAQRPVEPGTAVRIMTGGMVPEGTGAIAPVEIVAEEGDAVVLRHDAEPGVHVRPAGEDVPEGMTVAAAGTRLRAPEIGMLAAVGRLRVLVHPRPRVVVLSTGDELADPGTPLGAGQIHDSNSYMLASMAREAGAMAVRHATVPDDRRALQEAFEGALANGDLLVTSGGVSAGRYDFVKEVLAHVGDVAFAKVAMQPGKPQAFGFVGRDAATAVPCFGLPGNPVSAFVSFEVFVRPAIRRLQGRTDLNRPRVTAQLDEPVESPQGKVSFLRVTLRRVGGGGWRASTTGPQGSGMLHSVMHAHGLAEVPADRTRLSAGDPVVVHLLVDAW
jgi:molybdopterin molybdotransferase